MGVFRYLKGHLGVVAVVILLLIVQAYCDLALPNLTSVIVDVGITQGGIEDAVPNQIRRASLDDLELFMTDDEVQQVEAAYTAEASGVLHLQKIGKSQRASLNGIFQYPEVLLSGGDALAGLGATFGQGSGGTSGAATPSMDINSLLAAAKAGTIQKAQLLAIVQQARTAVEQTGMAATVIPPIASQYLKAEYQALGINLQQLMMNYMLYTGGKMLLMVLIMVAVMICTNFLASRTSAEIGRDLRRQIYEKTLSFNGQEIDHFTTASLITRNTNDIQQIQFVMVLILRMVLYAPVLGIGGIIMVAGKRTGLSWLIFIAVAFIVCVMAVIFSLTMPKFRLLQRLVDKVNKVSREILTGLNVIRAFSRQKFEEGRFDAENTALMKTQRFANRVMGFLNPIMMLAMNGFMAAIIWFAAERINSGNLLVGDLIAFMTYTMIIVMSFMMITMISIMLPRANVAAQRVQEVLKTEPAVENRQGVKPDSGKTWNGVVQYNNVSFHYPVIIESTAGVKVKKKEQDRSLETPLDAIHNISFTAEPGKVTAIIGSTGSGKSTIVNLLPRFYDVTGGSVTIDGVDVRDMDLHELHRILGFAPQKATLFSGTIETNLKFGDAAVNDPDMLLAAEISQAEEFIDSKPEKYDSAIAEGGTNVSGGQKQRLAIARAIAKKPRIYVFDDSFSALDYKTDAALRRALRDKVSDATVIIVAQRISTVMHADQILVMDEGSLVGKGTHAELMKTCETYQQIARSQLSEAELAREVK